MDAKPPITSFMKSMLIGGGPVNASVLPWRSVELEFEGTYNVTSSLTQNDGRKLTLKHVG